MLIQLDLFQEKTQVDILEEKVSILEKSMDKQRKALFAKHGALCKQYMELHERFEILERVLCKGKYGNFE